MLSDDILLLLETPCIVVDVEKTKNNIKSMQKAADNAGCKLRPHIKTHKTGFFANEQINAGAVGITCAKVGEAEVMADAGIKDIFIAYPLIGESKLRRAIGLANKLDRLILSVDSRESAEALQKTAHELDKNIEVRLEVDTGAKRTGIPADKTRELADHIRTHGNLRLTGLWTFKSLNLKGAASTDAKAAAIEEAQILSSLRTELRQDGFTGLELSGGSTPTGLELARTGLVDEIRPGTYIFGDYMTVCEGALPISSVSARIVVTVVSVPDKGLAVIDAGCKVFACDATLDIPPFRFDTYGYCPERPDLSLRRINEEHGMLESSTGSVNLNVGDKLCFIPLHICTAVNLADEVVLFENGGIRVQRVDARGKSR